MQAPQAAGPDARGGGGYGGQSVRRAGPYVVVTRLDGSGAGQPPVSEIRHIARTPDGDRTVLLSTPHPRSDPGRFLAEADASRYLLGPAAFPAVEMSGPGERAWCARPYLPVLPLPTALAVHGGPLPERTVLALGVALAETLSVIHGQGLVHAGVSPAAVLLSFDGPRLGCYGAVRAAAPDTVDPGARAPEQTSGGMPRPLGDVYALGATLAYAATGHAAPESAELPSSLRSTVGRCLSRDPAHRPQLAEIVDVLAPADPSASASPHIGFGTTDRSAALLGPGWLPGRLVAALAHQAASVLHAEVPQTAAGPLPYAP
ncbi:serine/threonine protein kinase [Streptomyces sp. SID8379]|uniref:serine/threonine protein kinase n=1 Tax=unclassified Streptomyces TaxID=2593676 RepID=UPI0003A0DDD6|nr:MULTISPECIES: serine/threonine protein kinase [unclassified Streptomyces]MYW69565.1 serine/threonine protein kinase [Streptomyces sp. SID8379]